MPVKQRKYASGVVITLGLAQTTGDLLSPKVTNAGEEEKLQLICPVCAEPHEVSQFYQCVDDASHTGYSNGDCARAKKVDDTLVRITQEQIDQGKATELPKNRLELRVHRREEVEQALFASGNAYVFQSAGTDAFYSVIVDFLSKNDDFVLLGLINLRGEKLMRLEIGLNGQLIFREMVWPEDVRSFDAPEIETSEKLEQLAKQLVESSVTPFEAASYKKQSRERMVQIVAAVAAGQAPAPAPAKKAAKAQDLESILEQALAAAQG